MSFVICKQIALLATALLGAPVLPHRTCLQRRAHRERQYAEHDDGLGILCLLQRQAVQLALRGAQLLPANAADALVHLVILQD